MLPMDEIQNRMELTLKRNMLKYAVGQAIFCPQCGTIMDAKRAVELEARREGRIIASLTVCAACYEREKEKIEKLKTIEGVTVEVTDGRELFKRRVKGAGK